MMWLIIAGAVIITVAALINKAVKLTMKLAVIAVMLVLVFYFLQQAGIIQSATMGH
ncbi:hypothetical protein [Pontiella sp.]|uniref:hypothetical protein n=1 Tax=Pontiella sp. TaxID=2837462 RepID=UPI0035613B9F